MGRPAQGWQKREGSNKQDLKHCYSAGRIDLQQRFEEPCKALRHYRLTIADALAAHHEALSFGGREGIIDLSRVESAIGRPYSGYYRAIQMKAAALVESMARNHGFVDGNKRTTLLLLHMLLVRSGYELAPVSGEDINDAVADLIVGIVNREVSFDQAVEWFRARVR